MAYQAKLQRSSGSAIGWQWKVTLPSGNSISDYALTKFGALWSIDNIIKAHKREIARAQNADAWMVE